MSIVQRSEQSRPIFIPRIHHPSGEPTRRGAGSPDERKTPVKCGAARIRIPHIMDALNINFTVRSAPVQLDQGRPGIMKNFWCTKKLSIIAWINGGVDFRPALERCSLSKCPLWNDSFCVHLDIREAGQ